MESDVDLVSNIAIIQTNTFLIEAFPRNPVACLFSLVENRKLIDFDSRKQQLATIKSQPAYWCSTVQELNRHHSFVPNESGKQRGQIGLQFSELQCNVLGDLATYKVNAQACYSAAQAFYQRFMVKSVGAEALGFGNTTVSKHY